MDSSRLQPNTAVSGTDIFASSSCNLNINTLDHMEKLKGNSIVGKFEKLLICADCSRS